MYFVNKFAVIFGNALKIEQADNVESVNLKSLPRRYKAFKKTAH